MKKKEILEAQHIGSRLHRARTGAGVSRQKLAEAVEVTRQQIAKYERGVDNIAASRLAVIAQFLNVPVHTFYDASIGNPDTTKRESTTGELEELVKAYQSIGSSKLRGHLIKIAKDLGEV